MIYVGSKKVMHVYKYKPWQSTKVSFQAPLCRHKTVFDVLPSENLKPELHLTITSIS